MASLTPLFAAAAVLLFFFFFNDTATTEIYTLSLHDALPISELVVQTRREFDKHIAELRGALAEQMRYRILVLRDRKSTRLNSSHSQISYAVFCLKKKKTHFHPINPYSTHQPLHRLTTLTTFA